jgi:hypothetical protein
MLLDIITDITEEIGESDEHTAQLHRDREAIYLEAQQAGATVLQMAEAAGLTHQGVKYSMARARRERGM